MQRGRKIDKEKLPPILQRYDDYLSIHYSPKTSCGRLYKLVELNDFMKQERGKCLEQMTMLDVEAYIAKLSKRKENKEIKQRSIKFAGSIIKMFSKWLVRVEIMSATEFYKIEETIEELRGERGEDNRVALSEDEEGRVLSKLTDMLLQFIMWLGSNFGLRLQEYTNLLIEHVELQRDRPTLKIELSKGHNAKTRRIPIKPGQAKQFERWLGLLASMKLPHKYLLYTPKNPSKRMTEPTLIYQFQKISKITGEHVHSQKLRYTYAVRLWKNKVDLWVISLSLGHDKPETTVKYLKIREEEYYDRYVEETKGLFD